jgi:D-amino peptidase
VKIYISADMEGVAGVVDWDQCRAGAPGHEQGARLLLGEVNAAIEGAIEGGADDVTVNDSHGLMANLAPDLLAGRASYLSGRHKPDYMMQGLDASYAGVLFVGYHGSMPSRSVLSHTYNPRAVSDARLGGVRAAESGINALAAAGHGVPVVLVTGDQFVGPEAEPFCPGIHAVAVKHSHSREAAESLHPEVARQRVREGARESVVELTLAAGRPVTFGGPLEVDLLTADMAEQATWVRGVEQVGERTISIATGEPLAAFRSFVAVVAITRGLGTA